MDEEDTNNICTICRGTIVNEARLDNPDCVHTYCYECILLWANRGANTCPLCKVRFQSILTANATTSVQPRTQHNSVTFPGERWPGLSSNTTRTGGWGEQSRRGEQSGWGAGGWGEQSRRGEQSGWGEGQIRAPSHRENAGGWQSGWRVEGIRAPSHRENAGGWQALMLERQQRERELRQARDEALLHSMRNRSYHPDLQDDQIHPAYGQNSNTGSNTNENNVSEGDGSEENPIVIDDDDDVREGDGSEENPFVIN